VKHLIAFLGYTQSRVQHPVYRQFVQAPISGRNASLLFAARPIEERELMHEVHELCRREEGPCEVSFHLCATLDNPAIAQQLVQLITLIRRRFDTAAYLYCLLPDLEQCTPQQRKVAWRSLVAISNLVADYPTVQLVQHCFLYSDASQKSLARLLFSVTQHPEAFDEIVRCAYQPKENEKTDFPPIFATFNADGITYPEEEIRYYLHQNYLSFLLSYSRPETNPVDMEQCNAHVSQLLSTLPLSEDVISLQTSSFLPLPDEPAHQWPTVSEYWTAALTKAVSDLDDLPRDLWLQQLRNSMDVLYETRFRDRGVEYFFDRERRRTSTYCAILMQMLSQCLQQTMVSNPYPPETSIDIVRSIVNRLQQLTLSFTQQVDEAKVEKPRLLALLQSSVEQWQRMGFIDRLRGRDKELFAKYQQDLKNYYIISTRVEGAEFAIKLLNELIPQLSALTDKYSRYALLCQGAVESLKRYHESCSPEQICGQFPASPISEALRAIQTDSTQLQHDYRNLVDLLYGVSCPDDSESLVQQLRDLLHDEFDAYIDRRLAEGTIPAVLGESLPSRIADLYSDQGGFEGFVRKLQNQTDFSVGFKEQSIQCEQYLLISPDGDEVGIHFTSRSMSSLYLIHLHGGLSLPDLQGFAGQRMFVEPSIF